jgi:hypothetical protein
MLLHLFYLIICHIICFLQCCLQKYKKKS